MSDSGTEQSDPSNIAGKSWMHAGIIVVLLIPLSYSLWVVFKPVLLPSVQPVALSAADEEQFKLYLQKGLSAYNKKEFESAIRTWDSATQYNPTSALIYYYVASAYGGLYKWNEEIKYCEKAMAINSDFALAKNNLLWATEELNKQYTPGK